MLSPTTSAQLNRLPSVLHYNRPVTFDARDIVSVLRQDDAACPNHTHARTNPVLPRFLKDLTGYHKRLLHLGVLASDLGLLALEFGNANFDPDRLTIIFENLDACWIPTSSWSTVHAKRAIELAHYAATFIVGLTRRAKHNVRLAERLRDAWPALWVWVRFLLVNVVEKDGDFLRPTTQILECLGHSACTFAADPFFHQTVARTPAFLQTLTYHWLEEEESGVSRGGKGLDALLTDALDAVLRIGYSELPFEEVIQAIGPKAIAFSALRRLQAKLGNGPMTGAFMRTLGLVMHLASPRRKSPMYDHMLEAGSPRQIVQILHTLGSHDVDPMTVQTTFTCYLLLGDACKHPVHGHRYTLQAVNAGLFAAIPGTVKFLQKTVYPKDLELSDDLFQSMMPYLLDVHVVRFLGRQLKRNPSLREVDAPLKEVVTQFVSLVDARREALRLADQHMGTCVQCNYYVLGDKDHLKQCVGCGSVRYCCKACQAAHWPAHRPFCIGAQHHMYLEARRAPGEPSNSVTYRQRTFTTQVTFLELAMRKGEIDFKLALWGGPRNALLVSVDYTQVPATLSISQPNKTEWAATSEITGDVDMQGPTVESVFLWEGRRQSVRGPFYHLTAGHP